MIFGLLLRFKWLIIASICTQPTLLSSYATGLEVIESLDRDRMVACSEWRKPETAAVIEEKTREGTAIITGNDTRYKLDTEKTATPEERAVLYGFLIRSAILYHPTTLSLTTPLTYFFSLKDYPVEIKEKIYAHQVAVYVISQAVIALNNEQDIFSFVCDKINAAQNKTKNYRLCDALSHYQDNSALHALLNASSQPFETLFKTIYFSLMPKLISADYLLVESGKPKPEIVLSATGLRKKLAIPKDRALKVAKKIIKDNELVKIFETVCSPLEVIKKRISYLTHFFNDIKQYYPDMVKFLREEVDTITFGVDLGYVLDNLYISLSDYLKCYNLPVKSELLSTLQKDLYLAHVWPFELKKNETTLDKIRRAALRISGEDLLSEPSSLSFMAEEQEALELILKALEQQKNSSYIEAKTHLSAVTTGKILVATPAPIPYFINVYDCLSIEEKHFYDKEALLKILSRQLSTAVL